MFADEANSADKQRGTICAELFSSSPIKIFCRDLKIPKNIFSRSFALAKLHTIKRRLPIRQTRQDKQRGRIPAELFITSPIVFRFYLLNLEFTLLHLYKKNKALFFL